MVEPTTAEVLARLDAMNTALATISEELREMREAREQWEDVRTGLDSLSELGHEINSISGAGMARLTDVLQAAQEKGYFIFARQAATIADTVVTSFTEEDVEALGENVVTILNAVKEMTQPEVMGLLQRTMITVAEGEDTHLEPPSVFALLKSMRDPQTRRGLARIMSMLHTVGSEDRPVSLTT